MEERKIRMERGYRNDFTIRSVVDEEVDIVRYLYLEKEYDENGNLLTEKTLDEEGNYQEFTTYGYDERNRRILVQNHFDEEEITDTTHFEFGEGEQPVGARRVYADGSEDSILYTYDPQGNLIERKVVNEDGDIEELVVRRYNMNHQEVFYERTEQGEVVFREEQEYNTAGKPVRVVLWEGDTDRTTEHRVIYDDDGYQKRLEKYNDTGRLVAVTEILRQEEGRPLEVSDQAEGGASRTLFTYDDQGRAVLQQEFNAEDLMINEIIRSYDEAGNLITTEVTSDRQGLGMNMHYRIDYEYLYFSE
ncbi:MAG TPA: hypothetical protein P5228_06415 [Bacteroidales bacterium]|nr:hypothetical protein [Bacteroidales bacterium]HRZ49083.1 hypothetical protein [Bacteroidales bacterium]